ncbi:MAG: hypothetical protein NTU89_00765 [Candidatus Dependentiae bacterium]|nr:hypothetical protein [Candidatus Dependentiae bacterium]
MNRHIIFSFVLFLSIQTKIFTSDTPRSTPRSTPRMTYEQLQFQLFANFAIAEYSSKNPNAIPSCILTSDKSSIDHVSQALNEQKELKNAPLDTQVLVGGLQFRQAFKGIGKSNGWEFNAYYSLINNFKTWL